MDSGMIDIHSHILYGVDDGASDRKISVEMLQEASRQGVTDIIATPHYRQGMFSYPAKKIFSNYQELRREAHKIGIRLSLGCEYFVDGDIYENLEKGRVPTLAGTRYVLTEYSPDAAYNMVQTFTQGLVRQGYIPVIAHVERVGTLVAHPDYVRDLVSLGAKIQVNAGGVLGKGGLSKQRFITKLLKADLVDFVASDAHDMKRRPMRLEECAAHVEKRVGRECMERVFYRNAKKLLQTG